MENKDICSFPDCGQNIDDVNLIGYGQGNTPQKVQVRRLAKSADITTHNSSANAHSDIRAAIPTKTSDLTNDGDGNAPFITSVDGYNLVAGQGISITISGGNIVIGVV